MVILLANYQTENDIVAIQLFFNHRISIEMS